MGPQAEETAYCLLTALLVLQHTSQFWRTVSNDRTLHYLLRSRDQDETPGSNFSIHRASMCQNYERPYSPACNRQKTKIKTKRRASRQKSPKPQKSQLYRHYKKPRLGAKFKRVKPSKIKVTKGRKYTQLQTEVNFHNGKPSPQREVKKKRGK